MRWFTRKPASRFPSDMIRRLELLGRFSLDSQSAGVDSGEVWSSCIAPFLPAALPFIDGGIDFKLSRGLPTASLTGYEMQRLVQRREAGG